MPEEQQQPQSSPPTTPPNGTAPILQNLNGGQGSPTGNPLSPDLVKTYSELSRFKTDADLAKSYVELNKLQSRSLGKIPDATATEEERRAFYTKIGAPEKADGYEFKRPEGVAIDETLEKWFRETAYANGIPKATAEKLYDGFVEQAQALMENAAGSVEKWRGDLKKEWGYQYDRNVRIAGNTLGHLIGLSGGTPDEKNEMVQFLNSTHLGDHPAFVKFFHALASKFGEDQLVETDVGPTAADVDSAKQELAELTRYVKDKKQSAYWRGDKDAVARVAQLREIIAAGQ